jgi:hypothetical protein
MTDEPRKRQRGDGDTDGDGVGNGGSPSAVTASAIPASATPASATPAGASPAAPPAGVASASASASASSGLGALLRGLPWNTVAGDVVAFFAGAVDLRPSQVRVRETQRLLHAGCVLYDRRVLQRGYPTGARVPQPDRRGARGTLLPEPGKPNVLDIAGPGCLPTHMTIVLCCFVVCCQVAGALGKNRAAIGKRWVSVSSLPSDQPFKDAQALRLSQVHDWLTAHRRANNTHRATVAVGHVLRPSHRANDVASTCGVLSSGPG